MASLVPFPKFQAFDLNGLLLNGGKLFTYQANSSTKLDTYTTSAGNVANTNPVVLDSSGLANVWIDPTYLYKFVLAPSTDTDPPTNPIWTVDNIGFDASGMRFIQGGVGAVANTVQAKERERISILDFCSAAQRVSALAWDFSVDCSDAWQRAINYACTFPGGSDIDLAHGGYLLQDELDLTSGVTGNACSLRIIGNAGQPNPDLAQVYFNHTGHGFDCTGSSALTFMNLSVYSDSSTIPQTAWLLARDDTNASAGRHRFYNCQILGAFSKAVWYSYASEENDYISNWVQNRYTAAAGKIVCLTSNNILSVTSSFATIATGAQSNIVNNFFGGSYYLNSGHASSDVFYLDQADKVRWFGTWSYCASAAANGRSLVYVDTTNGASNNCSMQGFTGETSTFKQKYVVYFGDTAATVTGWGISNSVLVSATRAIFAHSAVTMDNLYPENIFESSNLGIEIAGTLTKSFINAHDRLITVGTLTKSVLIGDQANWTITNDAGSNWLINTGSALVFVGTLTGCTTSPTYNVYYTRNGRAVTLYVSPAADVTATSNAVTKTITGLPTALIPTLTQRALTAVSDNGGGYVVGSVTVTQTTGVISIFATVGDGNWTNSGTATIKPFSITYALTA